MTHSHTQSPHDHTVERAREHTRHERERVACLGLIGGLRPSLTDRVLPQACWILRCSALGLFLTRCL